MPNSAGIHRAAQVHLPGADVRCPICLRLYSDLPTRRERHRTVGHLVPRDPKGGKHQRSRRWIWLCSGCNHTMREFTLRTWRAKLAAKCAAGYHEFNGGSGLRWLNACRVIRRLRRMGIDKQSF